MSWICVCVRVLPVLLLSEDWYAGWLQNGDLNQRCVELHWLPVIIGYYHKLRPGDTERERERERHTHTFLISRIKQLFLVARLLLQRCSA